MSSQVSNNPFASFINTGLQQTDIGRKTNLTALNAREFIAEVEKYMIIAAVALAAIGIVVACTAGAAAIIPLVMSCALVYGIYNLERVKTNIDHIIAEPLHVTDFDLPGITINLDKLKDKLKEKTFYFDWAIDFGVNHSSLATI